MRTFLLSLHSPAENITAVASRTSSRESAFSSDRIGSFFISRRWHWQLFTSAMCRWRWNRYRPESFVASLILLLFTPREQPGLLERTTHDFTSNDARSAARIRQLLGTSYRSGNLRALIYEDQSRKSIQKVFTDFYWFIYDLRTLKKCYSNFLLFFPGYYPLKYALIYQIVFSFVFPSPLQVDIHCNKRFRNNRDIYCVLFEYTIYCRQRRL